MSESAVGAIVYVAGDEAGWEHEFTPGTEVVVVQDAYLDGGGNYGLHGPAGDYLCRATNSIERDEWWIAATDLDLEPPVSAPGASS